MMNANWVKPQVNVGPNSEGPKVRLVAFVKLSYMLEHLEYLKLLSYNKVKGKYNL